MQKIVFILLLLGLTEAINSQTVDSIKVEQSGDFIKIRYQIRNSNPDQIYRVKVLCSINGGLNNELRSVSGDTGDHIVGGKPEYWVVWDVLKDVDQVNSVEFIVRAELVSETDKGVRKEINWSDKKMHVLVVGDRGSKGNLAGIRLGYMGKFGITAKVAKGSVTDDFVLGSEGQNTEVPLLNTSLDLSARLVNSRKFQLHYLLGIAYCKVKAEQDYHPTNMEGNIYDMYPGINFGLVFDISRICLTIGGSAFLPSTDVPEGYNIKPGYISAGLGVKF
jgi:hypothetical protein